MEFIDLFSLDDLNHEIADKQAAAFYFSAPHCNVCKVLKPKLQAMLEEDFPEFKLFYVDIEKSPVIAGQMRIFSIPTLLVYFGGKEFYRISRNISLEELRKTIERPYNMIF
ncbi:MAG: thioredoxin family protein [Bacteroidales bacterium]|nr:thioredoxin family protein [Bacteroidales bacterium]